MSKSEKATDKFKSNFNCAQSVLSVFADDLGMREDDCLKIASAFGGGIAKRQHTCGAVTAALMAIGLKYGNGYNDDPAKKTITYELSNRFIEEFKKLNGAMNCKELLNDLNMNDPEDLKTIHELDLFRVNCDHYVQTAVILTEQLLEE